jgi:hypothetical protein
MFQVVMFFVALFFFMGLLLFAVIASLVGLDHDGDRQEKG